MLRHSRAESTNVSLVDSIIRFDWSWRTTSTRMDQSLEFQLNWEIIYRISMKKNYHLLMLFFQLCWIVARLIWYPCVMFLVQCTWSLSPFEGAIVILITDRNSSTLWLKLPGCGRPAAHECSAADSHKEMQRIPSWTLYHNIIEVEDAKKCENMIFIIALNVYSKVLLFILVIDKLSVERRDKNITSVTEWLECIFEFVDLKGS